MGDGTFSRRDVLRVAGGVGAAAIVAGSKRSAFAAPAVVRQTGDPDLSDPAKVGEALTKEGATLNIHTWGFSGLRETVFVDKFAEHTKNLYGVPVKLTYDQGDINQYIQELPLAGRHIRELGLDVIDKEEETFAQILALDWGEPVDQEQYQPLLTNLADVEDAYKFQGETDSNGPGLYGVVYQGYEWLQALLRKDKVDASAYKDWTDLARPEMAKKGIVYSLDNDSRGHFVFLGLLNSLVKQGIVPGNLPDDLWKIETWEAGLQWWKDNIEGQIYKYGDIGNDPTMRLALQSGDAWWGGTWGTYTRELLAIDWNKRDDLLAPFYPVSGIVADRETLTPVAGAAHPVAARILINWFIDTEFQHVGWYKDTPTSEAVNRWNVPEDKYLLVYCGGVAQKHRDLAPDWAKPYYLQNPSDYLLTVNWGWYTPNAEAISRAYTRIVKGG